MRGGPVLPLTTSVAMTTCTFLRAQSRGARLASISRYLGSVTNSPAAMVASRPIPPTTDWTGATFIHATTGFTLVGLHATQQCAACHVGNNYSLTSAACWNCHQTDYNGATNPPHLASGFPQDCTQC